MIDICLEYENATMADYDDIKKIEQELLSLGWGIDTFNQDYRIQVINDAEEDSVIQKIAPLLEKHPKLTLNRKY